MILTRLEEAGKKQVRVFFDEESFCLLYQNECRKLHLKEEMEITQEVFEELHEMLLHRAKLKAMSLLKYCDRTKKELQERLLRLEFPEFIIEEAILYVESYGYINDEEYVRKYLEYRGSNKSRRQICQELKQKGIADCLLEYAFDTLEYDEDYILRTQIEKRIRQKGPITRENFQKYYAYFARKGFPGGHIVQLLNEYQQ